MHIRLIPLFLSLLAFTACNEQGSFSGSSSTSKGAPQAPAPEVAPASEPAPVAGAAPVVPAAESTYAGEVEKTSAEQPVAEQPVAAAPVAGEEAPPPFTVEPPATAPEIDNALQECIAKWGNHPFSEEQIRTPTLLKVSDSGQLNNSVIFSHAVQSDNFKLYVVNFDIRIGNTGTMELLDKLGWYCIYITAKVVNNFTVNHQCENKVAIVSRTAQNANNFQVVPVQCP